MQLSTSILTKSKLSIMALAALGLLAIPMAGSADAKPYRPGPASLTAHANFQIAREFRALDKTKNGILSRADFRVVNIRWVRVGRRWRKIRRVTISPRFFALLREMDFNRNGWITLAEYRRAKLASYTPYGPRWSPSWAQRVSPSPAIRIPAPARPHRVTVRDHRF